MSDEGYIIEYIVIGNSVKATAIDPVTMKEVSVIGTITTPKEQLAKLAVRKLIYVLRKEDK